MPITSYHVDTTPRTGITVKEWVRWPDRGVDSWRTCNLTGEVVPQSRSLHLDSEATSCAPQHPRGWSMTT